MKTTNETTEIVCECGHSVKNHDDAGCNHEGFIIHNTQPNCSCQVSNSDVLRSRIQSLQTAVEERDGVIGKLREALLAISKHGKSFGQDSYGAGYNSAVNSCRAMAKSALLAETAPISEEGRS